MRPLLGLIALSLVVATPAFAKPAKNTSTTSNVESTGYVVPYVGIYDILDNNSDTQFGVEYRFPVWDFGVRPTLGASITDEGDVYGYGGFNWDVALIRDQLYLIPNFMIGAYGHNDGKDLGGVIEFRSGIEIAYQFENAMRVGVAFNHVSNAGIYDRNPGEETLLINFALPTASLFGGR